MLQGLVAGLSLSACGLPGGLAGDKAASDSASSDSTPSDSAPEGCPPLTPDPETWVELRLEDYPALREPGGVAEVQRSEHLLDVVVVHLEGGCFIAVWRICTHGACPVAWEPAAEELWCDCHGSRFAQDGAVLEGPATRPLAAFPVVQEGDSLWLDRGL
ncbi:MAG: Rieske (2Fe-2S) protein [Alphaproteobacteria bacterium]|nr:Rieske (2Fe-2S) protein [Alphaproteobacteria bacterium]